MTAPAAGSAPAVDPVGQAMRLLWKPDPERSVFDVFVFLDGARDPWIHTYLRHPALLQRCFFSGNLPADFARAAPYVVSLSRTAVSTRQLLAEGLGKSWGVFLQADSGLPELREHFRRFLQVKDDQGRRFFFRFYDPRVLRLYLPTCSRAELFEFFGPVRRFVIEGEGGRTLETFAIENRELVHRTFDLEAP